jgi:hypothetical protein
VEVRLRLVDSFRFTAPVVLTKHVPFVLQPSWSLTERLKFSMEASLNVS